MNMTNPTTQAQRRYYREFTIAIVAYVILVAASVYGLNRGIEGFAKYLVAVVPAVPVAGVFIAAVRWLRNTDEYQRQNTITSLAIAGGLTALIEVTYGFLEIAGLPKMSVWISYVIFMAIWLIATVLLQLTRR